MQLRKYNGGEAEFHLNPLNGLWGFSLTRGNVARRRDEEYSVICNATIFYNLQLLRYADETEGYAISACAYIPRDIHSVLNSKSCGERYKNTKYQIRDWKSPKLTVFFSILVKIDSFFNLLSIYTQIFDRRFTLDWSKCTEACIKVRYTLNAVEIICWSWNRHFEFQSLDLKNKFHSNQLIFGNI